MAVYLLHFEPRYQHSGHYLGSTPDDRLQDRLAEHRAGHSAAAILTANAVKAGCQLILARVWPGMGRTEERQMKGARDGAYRGQHHRGGLARYCPICREAKKWGKVAW